MCPVREFDELRNGQGRHATAVRRTAVLSFLVAAACQIPHATAADRPLPAPLVVSDVQAPADGSEGVFILADRRTVQRLQEAENLLKKEKYAEAVQYLQRILESGEDSFFHPDGEKKTLFRSVRAEARTLLGSMPAKGREIYEVRFGATSSALLKESLATGDGDILADISRRFFFTSAGYEATYRLGHRHFDRGRILAAGLCFESLRKLDAAKKWEPMLSLRTAVCWSRSGFPDRATAILSDLAESQAPPVKLRGQRFPLDVPEQDRLVWLSRHFGEAADVVAVGNGQWAMYRGNPARNSIAAVSPRAAVGPQWSVTTLRDPFSLAVDGEDTENLRQIRSLISDARQRRENQQPAAIPARHALAVGNRLFARTLGNVTIHDLETGDLRSLTYGDDALENALTMATGTATAPLAGLIEQRIWDDATFGTLSSDGIRLYCVEHTGLAHPTVNPVNRSNVQPDSTNQLFAYDVQTGKIEWEVGGSEELKQFYDVPLTGTFFLGPPLPLAGRLYCLAESSAATSGRAIRLLVLDPRTGELDWAQSLAIASTPISNDRERRLAGSSASYADGILVCPTDAGGVVAVDLTNRSLLWGYRVKKNAPRNQPGRGGWTDSTATIVDGKVLLTPPGLNELHCLNLLDGKQIWKTPREDGLYIAGANHRDAVIVGSRSVRLLNLQTGKPSSKKPIPLSQPSGHAIIQGAHLHVPLQIGDIATIDLTAGRVVARNKLPSGDIPGNLISISGMLVSQGVDSLEMFSPPALKQEQASSAD